MNTVLPELNDIIKSEANLILNDKGISELLKLYGIPHITGSYSLDLMTWRDLDIYLETNTITKEEFFLLGSKIADALEPVKMSFRNEIIARTFGLPQGLYWGIYLGNEREGAWKIDIWAIDTDECKQLINYCAEIKNKLTPVYSQRILDIKSQCWSDPEYRRSYSSMDIYNAVFEKGVKDLQGFKQYLKASNKTAYR